MDIQEAIDELRTIRDLIRWGTSRFAESELWYGHGTDNPLDEAAAITYAVLNLPHQLDASYLESRLTRTERERVLALFKRRIEERVPVPYLTHEAWFCGLPFYVDERVLIPRSPICELIEGRFSPWIGDRSVNRALDIGTGSGCIAIAMAHAFPEALVDAVDIDPDALAIAELNVQQHALPGQVNVIESDLFAGLGGRRYELIVSNPPYVSAEEMSDLPEEYRHEPERALVSGEFGLDHVIPLLSAALDHLDPEGLLVVEVGNSWEALEAMLPEVPFHWVEFERGGDGVFALDGQTLQACAKAIREVA